LAPPGNGAGLFHVLRIGIKLLRIFARFRIRKPGAMYAAMRHFKPILTFCLCLAMLATSVTSAMARGQMAAGQMVQLCANGQAINVMVDANGNPIDASQHCPECLAVTGDLPPTTPKFGCFYGQGTPMDVPTASLIDGHATTQAIARGPPALI
jgi:hypothetical protein